MDLSSRKQEARTLVAFGVPASVVLAAAGIALWHDIATHPCPPGGVCLGHTTYHSHALLSILLWAASAALLAGTLVVARRVSQGRPAVVGGWRHPIDAGGMRFRQLPYWRRVALVIVAFPIVSSWWVIYQVRRLLFGPVD